MRTVPVLALVVALLFTLTPASAGELRFANPEYECIWSGGNMSSQKLDLLILAEGFTESEMTFFRYEGRRVAQGLLEFEPFSTYCDFYRIWLFHCVSQDSGSRLEDHPEKNTCFSAFYGKVAGTDDARLINLGAGSTENIELVRQHFYRSRNLEVGNPSFVVLVNCEEYGGGAGFLNNICRVSTTYKNGRILAHELAHSLVGLGDEYMQGDKTWDPAVDGKPNPNLTTNPNAPPWTAWLGVKDSWQEPDFWYDGKMCKGPTKDSEVGAFEGGGTFYKHGLWRPTWGGCAMADQNSCGRLCRVCNELTIRGLYKHVDYVPSFGTTQVSSDDWYAWVEVAIPKVTARVWWVIGDQPRHSRYTDHVVSVRWGHGDPADDYRTYYFLHVKPAELNKPIEAIVFDATDQVRMSIDGVAWYYRIVGPFSTYPEPK